MIKSKSKYVSILCTFHNAMYTSIAIHVFVIMYIFTLAYQCYRRVEQGYPIKTYQITAFLKKKRSNSLLVAFSQMFWTGITISQVFKQKQQLKNSKIFVNLLNYTFHTTNEQRTRI